MNGSATALQRLYEWLFKRLYERLFERLYEWLYERLYNELRGSRARSFSLFGYCHAQDTKLSRTRPPRIAYASATAPAESPQQSSQQPPQQVQER